MVDHPFTACLAGRHDPVGLTDRAEINRRIERFHAERFEAGPGSASR